MMRSRGVVAALVGLSVLLPVTPASAAEGDPVTGYWSRTRLGPPVPVEAPTPVPEGGTWVASDPTGPLAVSALRLELAPGVVPTALRLQVDQVQGNPAIRLCPAVARWRPQQGGPMESAPAYDCKVVLQTKLENGVLLAVLPAGFATGALDVVLTPVPGSAFSATFAKATARSVTVTSASPPADAPRPAAAPPPAPEQAPEATGLPPLGQPALPPAPPAAGSATVAAPQAAPAPGPLAAPPPTPPIPAAAALPVGADDRREAVPAAVVLVLLGAFALWLRAQPAAAPRRLGGGAGLRTGPVAQVAPVSVRGVGRFRDVRTARPVRL